MTNPPLANNDDANAWIDRLCDEWEANWQAGAPVALESLLPRCPAEHQPQVMAQLLLLEQEYRARVGQPLTPEEAQARFAGLGAWTSAVLAWAFPPAPVLTVAVRTGPHAGEHYMLVGSDRYTIGRQQGLSVSLPNDGCLSRVHLLITLDQGMIRVMDLGSKGGTYVGGQRVPQWDFVNEGTVRLGNQTELQLSLSGISYETTQAFLGPPRKSYATALTRPVIPGYRLGDELGRGGMGIVYRAVHEASNDPVAIKTILPSLAPTRTMVGRFCREADLMTKLAHPNIVGYRASGAAGNVLYVVLEYVPGVSAADLAKQGPIAPHRLLQWADQMLAGLAHAHAANIVHRDVKPSNLLVAGAVGAEIVKVADFGLARSCEASGVGGLTTDGTTCGTLAYMPPEQITDVRRVGPPADQYAAAATLYHLLTGQTIYPATPKRLALVGQILTDEPRPFRHGEPVLPEPFARVIRRALARDPAARYPTTDAMRQDLQRTALD